MARHVLNHRAGTAKPGRVRNYSSDQLNLLDPVPADDPSRLLTRVVGTLGPASQDVETLRCMLRAGMRVARIDLT